VHILYSPTLVYPNKSWQTISKENENIYMQFTVVIQKVPNPSSQRKIHLSGYAMHRAMLVYLHQIVEEEIKII
jgi:hypothetical protein